MVSLTCPSLQTLGKTQTVVISYFRISAQSLLKENCHNSRTSDDIDMKLGPLTKIDKRNKATSKKNKKKKDDDIMPANCDAIVIFQIYGQFGAIQKPDSGRIVKNLFFH